MARGVSPELGRAVSVHEVDLSTPQSRGAVFLNFVPWFVLIGQQVLLSAYGREGPPMKRKTPTP